MAEVVEVLLVGSGAIEPADVAAELAKAGLTCHVTPAATEPEMLAASSHGSQDLVIAVDSEDTFDAVAALSIARELLPGVPVIVIANAAGEEVAVEALKAGATDYIIADRLTRLGPAARRALDDARVQAEIASADAALRASENRFRGIFENAPIGIAIRRGRRLLYVNPSYLQIFGYDSLEDIPDRSFLALIAPEAAETGRSKARANLEPAEGTYEDVGMRKDGTVFPFEVRIANVDLGDGRATIAFVTDITERRRQEDELDRYSRDLEHMVRARTDELLAANEALQQATETRIRFLSSMSHELRVPLNSVIGFAGVLLQGLSGPLTDDQRKQIEMIYESGRQLMGTIDDVLDVARIEAGKEEVRWEQFELDTLARGLVESSRDAAAGRGDRIEVVVPETPLIVVSDRPKLTQILGHLVENAIKFTDGGTVSVVVERVGGADAVVRVRDTGIGIPPDELALVFEEFHQVSRPDGRRPEGPGLGLAICRKLAVLLGGSLDVTSEPGRGSEFVLTVPVGPVVELGGERP